MPAPIFAHFYTLIKRRETTRNHTEGRWDRPRLEARCLFIWIHTRKEPVMLKDVFLVGGVRTAIGSFSGAFAEMPAPALGSAALAAALERAFVSPDRVDEVIFGNVLSAGLGQNVAR